MAARPPSRPPPPGAGPPYRPAGAATYRPAPSPPPPPPPAPAEHVGFHMSGTEALHLGVSVVALTVAFAFAFNHLNRGPLDIAVPSELEVARAVATLPQAFAVVVLGFMLHEMAHKVVAQRLQLWAEFRASVGGLGAALGFCVFTSIIFAAPGAVIIVGNATRKDGALISIAGPATNLIIGFALLPFVGSNPNPAEIGAAGNFFQLAVVVNALLALFNLLPFPPLDGSKIVRWNVPVYVAMLALAGLLFWVSALGGSL